MQESKLKIDFTQGLLEVEGSEEIVREIYNDFKESLNNIPQTAMNSTTMASPNDELKPNQTTKSSEKINTPKPVAKTKSKTKPKKASDTSGTLLKNLNLMGDSNVESLRDFYAKYEIKTNQERTLVFVYYLQHKREIPNININHNFTCYRNIDGLKIPGNLKQNLLDTSSRKGWLDTADFENIQVPITGMNHVEHDLPESGAE